MFRTLLVLLSMLLTVPALGADRLPVVTTLPDLADWVRQIGGDRVAVRSLLQGFENPHTYEPRVSDVKALADARVLVKVGLGLEEWLDGLVENARNGKLLVVDASEGVQVIRDEDHGEGGHHHALGNPHVWLDPVSAAIMCRNIARGLESVDPAGGDSYRRRLDAYLARLDALARRVRGEVSQLADRRFISYHAAWPYFARGLGFEVAGVVTEIPGQEPSAKALAALITRIRAERLRVLVTEPQLSSKLPDLLHEETGIRVVTLSPLLGAGPAKNYLDLLDANATALLRALRETAP
jgi:ABC-type Zn uptake system ZnuABC Zn-binding protein ZnuA